MAVKATTRRVFTTSDGTPFFNPSVAKAYEFKLQVRKFLERDRGKFDTSSVTTEDRGNRVILFDEDDFLNFLEGNALRLEELFKEARENCK